MELQLPGAAREKGEGLVFNRYRVSVLQDGKSSGHWLQSNVNILSTAKLYI